MQIVFLGCMLCGCLGGVSLMEVRVSAIRSGAFAKAFRDTTAEEWKGHPHRFHAKI